MTSLDNFKVGRVELVKFGVANKTPSATHVALCQSLSEERSHNAQNLDEK